MHGMAIQCLTDPVTDQTKWQPVQPTNPNVSLQMQHRVWMPQNPTFQEWISSPSDPVSVANYSKHLTSKTKSLIQKLVFQGFSSTCFFHKKKLSKPSRTFPLKKNNRAKCINHPIDSAQKKSQNLQENTSRNMNAKVFWIVLRTFAWLIPLEPNQEQQMPKPNEPSPAWISCGNSSWSD